LFAKAATLLTFGAIDGALGAAAGTLFAPGRGTLIAAALGIIMGSGHAHTFISNERRRRENLELRKYLERNV
jgi:hypothetical protein